MEEKNNNTKTVWIGLVLLVVVLGIFSFYFAGRSKQEEVVMDVLSEQKPTLGQTLLALDDQVPFVYKQVKSSSDINLAEVNRDFSFFITSDAQSTLIKKLVFADGKGGFEFKYSLGTNLTNAYANMRKIAKTRPYVFVNGSRANEAAVITTDSDKYEVKILMEKIEENITNITVTIQSK